MAQNITVLGAGKSGLAAAELASQQGNRVFVSESRTEQQCADIKVRLDQLGVESEFGGHTNRALQASTLILSPGIPPTHPIRVEARNRNIEVIGELEYASRFISNKIIAVTGTNGKTTTTALTGYILNNAGTSAVTCGNIGTPLSSLISTLSPDTVVVAEVSSYQLDSIADFHPFISIILNITPDHIGYHGRFQDYVKCKWKIFSRQGGSDIVVLNADDEHTASAASAVRCTTAFFSTQREVKGAFVRGDEVVFRSSSNKEEVLMPTHRLGLPGLHNTYNSMASALASRAFEVSNEAIRESLESFSGVEHRLERVRIYNHITYINDSKATNVNAAWFALASFDRPIVWIAGGRADDNDYSLLDELVATNVKAIVCIGEQADVVFNHWCTTRRCVKAHTLTEAVQAATELAEQHDIVLLSPACKSFDMFSNYEERGRMFKQAVQDLK
ncbi:MAG: UDP-N-acetylmuramoyl-L-alanine--D-glutamate ligase [Ignavibacteria bacterium]|nr:UDP-N-acetylmuramoyl-L-alanine--D-glutamate ligase [Ignavibacteria bacterium]